MLKVYVNQGEISIRVIDIIIIILQIKWMQIKLTALHDNKRTIELLQGCIDYNTILVSQMLLIYQNNTLTRFLRYE